MGIMPKTVPASHLALGQGGDVPGMVFPEPGVCLLLLTAPGSEPAPRPCPFICCHFLAGQWVVHHLAVLRQPVQAGGQRVAGFSATYLCSGGYSATMDPPCNLGASVCQGEAILGPQGLIWMQLFMGGGKRVD